MRNNPFLAAMDDEDFPTCPGCNNQVYPQEKPIMALGKKWHPGCLKCTECGTRLTMRSLESYSMKPYCKAHVPKARATEVSESFHDKAVKAKPKAASRQKGIDMADSKTFTSGKLAQGGADTGTYGQNIQTADSGTWEKEAEASRADTGTHTGGAIRQSDAGTWEKDAEESRAHAGKTWGNQQIQSGTWEKEGSQSQADTGTHTGGAVRQAESGSFENNPTSYKDQGLYHEGYDSQSKPSGGGGYVQQHQQQFSAPPPSSSSSSSGGGGYKAPPPSIPPPQQQYQEEEQDYGGSSQQATCVALYDYDGQNEGDLSFYTGDVITILDDSDPSGWWQGELNGQQGFFPSNFVEKNS